MYEQLTSQFETLHTKSNKTYRINISFTKNLYLYLNQKTIKILVDFSSHCDLIIM